MRKIANRQNKDNQNFLFFHGLRVLASCPNSEKLSGPNSPLLMMLEFVDPNVLSGAKNAPLDDGGGSKVTLLHQLADLLDPSDYSAHSSQLILAKQLIEGGTKVNVVTISDRRTPLHNACSWFNVTNLDLVKLLLEKGANPNNQDDQGQTPLIRTIPDAPGAAKCLLNWPSTDVNITMRSGASFLSVVRDTAKILSDFIIAHPDNPEQVQNQFQLQWWSEIEEMLVERGSR